MMRVGFTGTQRGMTQAQKVAVAKCLSLHSGEFHHGDCVGADEEAHDIAVSLGWEPFIHPPVIPTKRAWKKARNIAEPLPYLVRNKAIVADTERLLAAPGEAEEQVSSGTWSTIRYARQLKRRIYLIFPDGRIKCEPHDLQPEPEVAGVAH